MPREAKPVTASPNGSMKTLPPSPSIRKADCPYHSTRMLLLGSCCKGGRELRLVGVLVAAAAHQRSGGRHQTGDDRERERRMQTVAERAGDQVGEKGPARDHGAVVRAESRKSVRADEVLDRVVAQEGGEQDRDGRQVRDVPGGRRAHP